MTTVGTFEAKTHLTQLLGRVARGERILITNRGQPVAMLVPPEPGARGDVAAVVREMLAARDEGGPTLGKGLTARQMREEGRRY
ncbi:MAG: type II toxin-antitoxin system prevent-host-death family antitoxin [Zavarzinella sp.]|nr:type II toxin-antitoxin system prevent-host-death family antitoxin [Zavarzinella sp.]